MHEVDRAAIEGLYHAVHTYAQGAQFFALSHRFLYPFFFFLYGAGHGIIDLTHFIQEHIVALV